MGWGYAGRVLLGSLCVAAEESKEFVDPQVPCGHVAMCYECAVKVKHSSRAVCVVCRQPIEKVLRAAPP